MVGAMMRREEATVLLGIGRTRDVATMSRGRRTPAVPWEEEEVVTVASAFAP
jgi:hypothetical protein